MKAVVCYGDGIVRYEDVDEPTVSSGTVKICVKACGICGSDIPRAMAHGAHSYPIVLGHEFSGVVIETADDVKTVHVGDHVVGVPLIPCHQCEDCKAGNYSLCSHYSFIGSRCQGAFADYIVVPERNAFVIDKDIPFEQAALFEPSTVSLHALFLNNFKAGGTVAILGGGTMGAFALQWSKIMGAKSVVVFGRDRKHLEFSSRLGADEVISTLDRDFLEKVSTATNGRGFDYIIEAAGSVQTMKYAFEIAAKKAHICFIGTPTEELSFEVKEWEQMNRKELTLTGSWMSYSAGFPGREWIETEKHFSDGSLRYDEGYFFAKYSMKEAEKAFSQYCTPGKVKGRILLTNF